MRDFISELRGLQRSSKQKIVLAETNTARTSLADFFERGPAAVGQLLRSCGANTTPVKPDALGLLGDDHLREDCAKLGGAKESFHYKKHLGRTGGLPYVIEVAFAYCPERAERRVIAGVNFSIAINNPFRKLGPFDDLSSVLSRHYVEHDDPVVIVLHFTCPHVDFSDHGKSALTLPMGVGWVAADLIKDVAKEWTKQRRAEERRESSEFNRRHQLLKQLQRLDKPEPAQPSGVLAEIITKAADRAGVKVDDLVVLSRENDPYTAWRRRRQAEWFAELFDRFVPPGETRHLRAFFYRLVSTTALTGPTGKPFVNDEKNWQQMQKAASAARWLGLVPFDRIRDERNAEPEIYVPEVTPITTSVHAGVGCDIPIDANDALPSFSLDGFRGRQTHRIIFMGEKSSLAPILRPIAKAIGAEMILVTGESSTTRLYQAMKRASSDGRPAVILYFADFDPSGYQMSDSVARKVQAFRDRDEQFRDLGVKLYRVALTVEQVRDLELPSSPFKRTEKRAQRWREHYGHEQTEIDAMVELHPDALRQVVYDAVRPFYDDTLDDRMEEAAAAWREQAVDALQRHPEYNDISERIEAAYERMQEAVDGFHEEQHRAAEILCENLPEPPELPTAAPTSKAKPALFDTETDFVTATRRLIVDKKLNGDNDDKKPLSNDDDEYDDEEEL